MVPPPAMGRRRGGHPHSGVLLEACWVRHPTEWGGEESLVPPARDGQEARWTPLCGVLLMAACWVGHPTEWGGEDNVVPPARDGQEARWTPLCGVLLMAACLGRRPGPPCSDGAVGRIHGTGYHDTPGWQIVEFVK